MSSRQVLAVEVARDDAEELVLGRLPGATCLTSRLLHHPYAGYVFEVDQAVIGTRMQATVHALVDLCSGAVAVSDPWRALAMADEPLDGPGPVLGATDADGQARHCVLRTLMHRRFSLRHPRVHLGTRVMPLYKPNWLLTLQTDDGVAFGVLVDGVNGRYHTVSLPDSRQPRHPGPERINR